jgi:hypothetical protein
MLDIPLIGMIFSDVAEVTVRLHAPQQPIAQVVVSMLLFSPG